jgi:hypothetical protein
MDSPFARMPGVLVQRVVSVLKAEFFESTEGKREGKIT